ncbi:MAG: hypothetical protein J7M25_13315 [Deltaproteobacteria bacterium]|nr:hypothetical protein [Deltaproteobacteria bacterium]
MTKWLRRAGSQVGSLAQDWRTWIPMVPFVLLAVGAVIQLFTVFAYRLTYPLDLEWMEGGVLVHAHRLLAGQGIYVAPTVDFVPFLYTPLHPALLAIVGWLFGLGYLTGRLVSILSFAGALFVAAMIVIRTSRVWRSSRLHAWTVALLTTAVVAVAYPVCGSWFDLVRNDSLWLLLTVTGLAVLSPVGDLSYRRTLVGALVMSAAFFTKQTAAPFVVAAVGALALVGRWRQALLFAAATVGLDVALVLIGQWSSDGWMWVYIYRLHQSHRFIHERLWPGTPERIILFAFPVWSLLAVWMVVVVVNGVGSRLSFFWVTMALCGLATSAVGSATQGAYDNALIPGLYFSAVAAGVVAVELPSSVRSPPQRWSLRSLWDRFVLRRSSSRGLGIDSHVIALAAVMLLSSHILIRWVDTSPLVPSTDMVQDARRLVARLHRLGPRTFVPYHPFYNVLAGGQGHMHIMGVNDASVWAHGITGDPERDQRIKAAFRRSIVDAFASHRWAAVIHDRTYTYQLPGLVRYYRQTQDLSRLGQAPGVLTGNRCTPRYLWVPR